MPYIVLAGKFLPLRDRGRVVPKMSCVFRHNRVAVLKRNGDDVLNNAHRSSSYIQLAFINLNCQQNYCLLLTSFKAKPTAFVIVDVNQLSVLLIVDFMSFTTEMGLSRKTAP